MLPKYVSRNQLLSDLTPERQARFLMKMRQKCYECNHFDEDECEVFTCNYYVDDLGQKWTLRDIIQALNKLPHVPNKKEGKVNRSLKSS